MFRRVLSLMLCVCMLVSTMPTWSVAALAEGEEAVVEVVEAPKEEKDPTPKPTKEPTPKPTKEPTPEPTKEPTPEPTKEPTPEPTKEPTPEPTKEPTPEPTEVPAAEPEAPAEEPTEAPAEEPTEAPTEEPTEAPAEEPTEAPAEEPTEAPVEEAPRFVNGYAFVKAGEKVYADEDLDEVLGTFPEKTVVYVSDREETQDEDQDILTLRFACEDKLVKGYIRAKRVQPLTDRESADYEEEAAADGVRYRDQIFVMSVAFDFAAAETEQPAAAETEQPAADETEQPAAAETEEPAASETEQPAAVETEQPAAAETEQPAASETEQPVAAETEEPAASETEEPAASETEEPVAGETEEPAAEEHKWSNGVCEECGAVCAHEQTTSQRYENAIDQQSIVDNGDGTHSYQAGCYILQQCSDCGMMLGHELEGELSGVTAAHEFGEDGACWICGAQNVCTHPAESSVKRTLSYIVGVIETGENYHVIDYDLYAQMYCQACGQFYGEQTAMGTQRKTEAHFFGEDGACNCGATGEPCADWEAHFKASEQHTALENIHTEQVTGEDGQVLEQAVATQVTGKQCALCGGFVGEVAVAQVVGAQADDPTMANAPAFAGELTDNSWDKPVRITGASQTGDKQVTLEWETEATAVCITDFFNGNEVQKKTVTAGNSVTLNGIAVGDHVFELRPCDAETGVASETNYHRIKFVVQSVAWKVAPAISVAKQVMDAEGLVTLTWTHKSRAESYEVYDAFYGDDPIAATTELSIVLEDQDAGKHSYTVKPVQKDSWGNLQKGTSSKAKLVTVAELWNKKPTLSVAVQKTSDQFGDPVEGLVSLSWKRAKGALTQAYAIQEYDAAKKTWSNVLPDGELVFSDEDVVTYSLQDVEAGKHTYRVVPASEDGKELGTANASASKAVTVIALWNKKGTITKAVQIKNVENTVELTWKSGSTMTHAWQICERIKNGKSYDYEPVKVGGQICMITDSVVISAEIAAEPGTHDYVVRPVKIDDEGNAVDTGTVSSVKSVKVAELWKAAPKITSLKQVTNTDEDAAAAVELSWTPGSETTMAYAVYEKIGKNYVRVTELTSSICDIFANEHDYGVVLDNGEGLNSVTIPVTKAGAHSYIVRPVKVDKYGDVELNGNELIPGTASAAKSVTVKLATWEDAPTLTAVQKKDEAEGEVLLQWSQYVQAEAFKIYEYKNKKDVPVKVNDEGEVVQEGGHDLIVKFGMTETVLKGVTDGTHTYSVRPLRYNETTGDYEEGKLSARKAVTVTTQWSLAPTITEAMQLTDSEESVYLKWKAGSPMTRAWYIKDGNNIVMNEKDEPLLVYDTEVVLTNVKAGSHKYTVIPALLDDGKLLDSGKASAAKSVTVYALWNKKPVIKSAVQLKDDERKIEVKWTSPALLSEAFTINVKYAGKTEPALKAADFKDALDSGEVTLEDGVYTAVIEAEGAGSNVISVVPTHKDGEAWISGQASATKTVSVKDLWKLAPTNVTVQQIKTSAELHEIDEYADLGEGMVLLTWVPGSYPNLADEFRIYDNDKEIDLIENESFIPVHVCDFKCHENDDMKHACQVILLDQSTGAHKYTVKPADAQGNTGTTSVARSLTVAELWKAKPTITSALQSSRQAITLTWKAGSEVTRGFSVTDKLGKTTNTYDTTKNADQFEFDADTDTYTLTITGLADGTHELSVKPYDGATAGTPSAAVKVTVVNTQWDAAPVMLSVEQGAIGQATLTWNHPAPGKGFIVYEMVGTRFVEITDPIEMTEFSCTVKVESTGMHTYAVRSYTFDEAGNTLVGTMSRAMSAELYASSDAAPQNVRVTRDRNTARVTWNEVPFADGYTIRMVKLSDQSVTTSDVGRQTSTTFTNITPDESYRFDVVAVFDGEESSAASSGAVFFGRPVEAKAETYNPNEGVVLTWLEPSVGAQGIKIYRMDGEQETLDEDEARIFSSNRWIANPRFVDDLAQPNEKYTYWVASYRSSGEDELSAPVVVSTEVKLDPVGQVSTYRYDEDVELTWAPVPNATEYAISRAEGANPQDKDYAVIGYVTGYEDESVWYYDDVEDAGRTYTYRIVSRWLVGSNWIEGAPSAVTIKPLAKPKITGAAFNAQKGAVEVTWDAVDGASYYHVKRIDSQKNEEWMDTLEASFTDTDIELNNAYTYYVVAVKAGDGNAERTSNGRTVQLSRLGKVTGLTQRHVNETVTLTWDAVPNAQYYVVERSSDGGESFVTVAENETKTRFEDAQVSDGETYLYRVSAAIKIGENVNLGAASTVTADISPRMKIEEIEARFSLKEGGAVITWPKSDKADATGYKIFRTEQGSTADPVVIEIESADTTTWTDTAVVDEVGKTFLYSVRVVRTSGEDGQSGDLEVKPVGLGKVQNVGFWYIEHDTHLFWDADEQADCYEVSRSTNGSPETIEPEWKDNSLTDRVDDPDATYVYTLRAVVKPVKGEPIYGEPSTVTVTRKPGASNVQLTAIEEGIQIKWTLLDTTGVDGFSISRIVLDKNNQPVGRPVYEQISTKDPTEALALAGSGSFVDQDVMPGMRYMYTIDVKYPSDNQRVYETDAIDMPNTLFKYVENVENDGRKTATIIGYTGKSVAVMTKIPETVDGLTVTHIGDGTNPFDLPEGVTMTGTLTLPSTVKVIGANAFKGFSGLTGTLTLPDGLVSIADEAFAGTGITGVVIPVGMTYLGTSAFDSCASLESVVFNGAVQTMRDGVFASCTALKSITLPEGMKKIPKEFLKDDAKLTGELIIPDSVTSIGENAFAGTGYTSLKSKAAVSYDELTKMGLRDTLEKLESDYDTNEEMSFEAFGLELKAERKAQGKTFELILHGEASDGTRYDKAEDGTAIIIGHTNASGALVLPATVDGFNVTKIGENAFNGNTAITSVIINGKVKEIGDGAFDGCTGMTTAVLPNSVEIIGVRGFANCTSLTTMTAQTAQ